MASPYIGKTLHYPKINHYHYEHGYLPDSARTSGNLTERDYVSSLSPFAPTSADYYMDCVTILTADESIHWFKLGLDFPAASYFIDRYEDVLTLKFVLSGKGTVYGKQCRAGDVFYTRRWFRNIIRPMQPIRGGWSGYRSAAATATICLRNCGHFPTNRFCFLTSRKSCCRLQNS